MWILVWLELAAAQNINFYHLGSYEQERDCKNAYEDAIVLVTGKNQSMECLFIDMENRKNGR